MGDMQELIEAPLSSEDLAARYRALCDDPCYANVPGKIELDVWARLLISPASNYQSAVREKVAAYLDAGAMEVWIVYPQSKRVDCHAPEGLKQGSQYTVDLAGIFS